VTPLVVTDTEAASWRGNLDPVVEALHAASGRPKRALWRTTTDRSAQALLWGGLCCGDADAGEAAAHAVLDGTTPLRSRPRFASRPHRVVLRAGCCLYWTTGEAPCETCPLAERDAQRK
jgi:hypothetical protein